jgi:hypothetical protein
LNLHQGYGSVKIDLTLACGGKEIAYLDVRSYLNIVECTCSDELTGCDAPGLEVIKNVSFSLLEGNFTFERGFIETGCSMVHE